MSKTIDDLAAHAGRMLIEWGYQPSTIQQYKASWNKVRRWCAAHNVEFFDADHERQLIKDLGLNDSVLTAAGRSTLRHIRTLLSIDTHGSLLPWSKPAPEAVPGRFRDVFDAYVSSLQRRRLADSTRAGQTSIIRKFLTSLSTVDFSDLSSADITAHIQACSWMTAQTRTGMLYILRAFTKWAGHEGWCSPIVAAAMPIIPGHNHASLPSAYTASEVAAMVTATSKECPRRDRAMLLLAAVLGIRAGDLRALRLSSIDWRGREIRFAQTKTGHRVRLPLPDEVMLAVADYLRNERPQSTDNHVFLHHRAPHHSFDDTSNSFHAVATSAYARASVDTSGKHHGMHSLRHSAATNMLSGDTPYPVISGILGHSNANTTRKYMAIDVEALRRLCLEVPRG